MINIVHLQFIEEMEEQDSSGNAKRKGTKLEVTGSKNRDGYRKDKSLMQLVCGASWSKYISEAASWQSSLQHKAVQPDLDQVE